MVAYLDASGVTCAQRSEVVGVERREPFHAAASAIVVAAQPRTSQHDKARSFAAGARGLMQKGSSATDLVGPYRVIKHLSVTGSVHEHLAREEGRGGFERDVVLKMVPKVSGEGAQDIEELTREVTVCAQLTHPSIVRVRHFFEHDD